MQKHPKKTHKPCDLSILNFKPLKFRGFKIFSNVSTIYNPGSKSKISSSALFKIFSIWMKIDEINLKYWGKKNYFKNLSQ